MRLISRFVSLLITPLVVIYGLSAQVPGGSAVAANDAAQKLQQDLQLRVVAADTSGTRRLIEVTNANGVGIPDVAVVFRLPDSAPTGTFSDGTHAAVAYTDHDGRATLPRIQWDSTAGRPPIRVSATKGTAHAGILIEQNVSAGPTSAELTPGVVALPTPPPVQQPGSITPVSGIPAQAPSPEPRVSITSATPQGDAHSGKTKWIVIAAIAVGAGVGVAMAMKGKSSSSTTTAATGLSIGTPSGGGSVGAPPH